ncbi:hypothetical protein [Marivita sp.]|uniref:hypothetical protein n=1 Tax=Marivita sp. TaxID=2003365 RepID=UPI003F70D064
MFRSAAARDPKLFLFDEPLSNRAATCASFLSCVPMENMHGRLPALIAGRA